VTKYGKDEGKLGDGKYLAKIGEDYSKRKKQHKYSTKTRSYHRRPKHQSATHQLSRYPHVTHTALDLPQ